MTLPPTSPLMAITPLQLALTSYWLLATTSAISARLSPSLSRLSDYGKLRPDNLASGTTGAVRLRDLTVPKSWFAMFYLMGLLTMSVMMNSSRLASLAKPLLDGLLLWLVKVVPFASLRSHLDGVQHFVASVLQRAIEAPSPPQLDTFLFYLYVFHLTRRFYEEMRNPPSSARMHVLGWLVGVSYYVFAPLTMFSPSFWLLVAAQERKLGEGEEARCAVGDEVRDARLVVAGVIIFMWASYHQYRCHSILRSLRRTHAAYSIPEGDWFAYSSSPHYAAEIILYLGMCLALYGTCATSSLPSSAVQNFGNFALMCRLN